MKWDLGVFLGVVFLSCAVGAFVGVQVGMSVDPPPDANAGVLQQHDRMLTQHAGMLRDLRAQREQETTDRIKGDLMNLEQTAKLQGYMHNQLDCLRNEARQHTTYPRPVPQLMPQLPPASIPPQKLPTGPVD